MCLHLPGIAPDFVYRSPRSVISTLSAEPIQRMLLHLSACCVSKYSPNMRAHVHLRGGVTDAQLPALVSGTPASKIAPDRINAPNQHQTQCSRVLSIDELFRITEQHVHVRIDALKLALVFRLTPLETDDDLGTDSAKRIRGCFPVEIASYKMGVRRGDQATRDRVRT